MLRFGRLLRSRAPQRAYATARAVRGGAPSERPSRLESIFMMALTGFVASELMYIIRTRNEKERLELEYKTEGRLLERLTERVRAGEEVDVDAELMSAANTSSESFDDILRSLEQSDAQWQAAQQAAQNPLRQNAPAEQEPPARAPDAARPAQPAQPLQLGSNGSSDKGSTSKFL